MPRKPPLKPGNPPIRPIDYTVNGDGCWVWNWSIHPKGYPSVPFRGKARKAHRVAYELVYGPIPEGQIIRHRCGNPSCVNPVHLLAGTPKENAQDMVVAGNQHGQKLWPADATEIRRQFAKGGVSRSEIARQYGVTAGAIRLIVANETFCDPDYSPPSKERLRKSGLGKTLDESSAKEIREIYRRGDISQKDLALEFRVSPSTISLVILNKLYPDPGYVVPSRKVSKRKLDNTQQEGSKARPNLQSISGPAPTGKSEQERRRRELRDPERKPRRKPDQPLITGDDWILDPETGCHIWRWGKKESEHGTMTLAGNKHILMHRVAWETRNGPIPEGGQINHRCNNTSCINPDHLYLGDQFDNMQDTVRVGNHAVQKLTWAVAQAIREDYEPGKITYKELADRYSVTNGTISNIVMNKTFHDPEYTPRNSESSVRRKLSTVKANIIRERYATERITESALGREFGVDRSVIGKVIRNETYYDSAYAPPSPDERRLWKLSNADKEAICSEYESGATRKGLAEKFGVSCSQIGNILRRVAFQLF